MIEYFNSIDTQLLLFLNSKHNAFLDFIMYWASNRFVWIPFYIILMFLIVDTYWKKSIIIILAIILLIALTDQTASNLIKNLVMRLRPSHEPSLSLKLHFVHFYKGGTYGFVSSHAANAFALAVFLTILFRRRYKWLAYVMFAWAVLLSYSRVYLGVHYPSDVVVGALIGALYGWLFIFILKRKFTKYVTNE